MKTKKVDGTHRASNIALLVLVTVLVTAFACAKHTAPSVPAAPTSTTSGAAVDPYLEKLLIADSVVGKGWFEGQPIIYWDVSGVQQVYTVNPSGQPTQITLDSNPMAGALASPDGTKLIYLTNPGGSEKNELFLLTNGQHTRITNPGVKGDYGSWSPNGKRFTFTTNERNESAFDIFIYDTSTNTAQLVFTSDHRNIPCDWSDDGRYIVFGRPLTPTNVPLFVVDVQTQQLTLVPLKENTSNDEIRFTPGDSSRLRILTDQDSEFTTPIEINWKTGDITYLDKRQNDANIFMPSRSGAWQVLCYNVHGVSECSVSTAKGKKVNINLSDVLPQGVISHFNFSPDERELMLTHQGPTRSANAYTLNLESGRLKLVTNFKSSGIDESRLIAPQVVHYTSFDGVQIAALLSLPHAAREPGAHVPVVWIMHGGPELCADWYWNGWKQYLLSLGYALFEPNVRGSTGYGKAFRRMDDKEKRMDAVRDMYAGVEYLKSLGTIDMQRMALTGGSYGGFMVLAGLIEYPTTWAAGVDDFGIADFITFLAGTAGYRREQRAAEYGSDTDFLKSISPIHRVSSIVSPLLVTHGANDSRVPVGQAEQIVRAIQAKHGIVEYLRLEDEGHGYLKRESRLRAYATQARFLNTYLK